MLRTPRKSGLSLSKLQSPITTRWLHENYEIQDGISLPRNSLYTHYLDFCNKTAIEPVNAASFGKIIRTTFPDLKTRRLGTRGQSKYHYYGISIRKSSPYYDTLLNAPRPNVITTFTPAQIKTEIEVKKEIYKPPPPQPISPIKTNIDTSPINETFGTILPDFPSSDSVDLDDADANDKVKTFLIMYKAHCQRILDTIIRANFAEVQNFLIHFWQGMPSHIAVILCKTPVIELIGSCDSILYKSIGSVLIPGPLQPLPASLSQAIQKFAKQLCIWLDVALLHMPEELQNKKMSVARHFSQLLFRQTSLSHLAQAARTVLHNAEPVTQMAIDFEEINVDSIMSQLLWITNNSKVDYKHMIRKFLDEFRLLLEEQSSIEDFAEWLSSLVTRCIIKATEKDAGSFQTLSQEFLLYWSFITSKVVQELTLKSAQSFGSFHLLQMLFDDYIFYLIESHADISEEIIADSATNERNYSQRISVSSSVELLSYDTIIRYSPSSSSGRGSLSPEKNDDVFNFPTKINEQDYQIKNYNLKPNSYPYDNSRRHDSENYPWYNSINNISDPSSFTVNNPTTQFLKATETKSQPFAFTEESNYSEDLDIVRVLQERTSSLMEATKANNTGYRYHPYTQVPVSSSIGKHQNENLVMRPPDLFNNFQTSNRSMYSFI